MKRLMVLIFTLLAGVSLIASASEKTYTDKCLELVKCELSAASRIQEDGGAEKNLLLGQESQEKKESKDRSEKKDKEEEKESPIKQIGDIGGFADDRTGQCWWTVTVKNTGEEQVKNVVLTLHVQDGNGKDYDTQIKPVGLMNPGDVQKVEFYWQGMRLLIVNPKIEITHDPLPEKEKTGNKEKQKEKK